jgi:hypothetical protein
VGGLWVRLVLPVGFVAEPDDWNLPVRRDVLRFQWRRSSLHGLRRRLDVDGRVVDLVLVPGAVGMERVDERLHLP